MDPLFKHNAIKSFIGFSLSLILFFSSGVSLPILDSTANTYFREAITRAGVTYATIRVINASVSIIKESSLELEPAGIGVSLAVGQALDPIDDMTERLSNVLVMAITSLGVQELTYEISVSLAPPILAAFLFLLSILFWFKNKKTASLRRVTTTIFSVILIARLSLPISSIVNNFIQVNFFTDKISDANMELALGIADLDKLKDFSLPEYDGLLGTIENSGIFLKQKSIYFKDVIATTVENMGSIIDSLLQLTFLYVGIFLIQVIILPLLIFWLLMRTVNSLFYTTIPAIPDNYHEK